MSEFMQQSELNFAQDSWRLFRIISEFVNGFDTFSSTGPFISIFGSARLDTSSPYYKIAYDCTTQVAKKGFSIITGAGPGIMEAINKAAKDNHVSSAGLVIDLPYELEPNKYLDARLAPRFRYFFVRKVMFVRYAQGFVFLPGGLGTLDELFEIMTLIQTKKIQPVPIYLVGSNYWKSLLQWLQETALSSKCISEEDIKLLTLTDNLEEVAEGLWNSYQGRTHLRDDVESIL